MNPLRLTLKNQFGEESINFVIGSVIPLVPNSDIALLSGATAPVNGGSGTGANILDKGSQYIAQDTGLLYINTGSKASPTWTLVESGNASVIGALLTGFAAAAGTVSATDSILAAIQKIVGNMTALQTAAETVAAAGAISTVIPESILNNASGSDYAATLAAPSSQDGQIKVLKMVTATHHVTVAMTNIAAPGGYTASGTTTITFANVGDSAILMAVGAKWQYMGGSAILS